MADTAVPLDKAALTVWLDDNGIPGKGADLTVAPCLEA